MNNLIHKYSVTLSIVALFFTFFLSGCTDSHYEQVQALNDEGIILIDVPDLERIDLRSELTPNQESEIKNLYVAVFNEDGTRRLFNRFYEGSELNTIETSDGVFRIKLNDNCREAGTYKAFAVANVRTANSDFTQRVVLSKSDLDGMTNLSAYKTKKIHLDKTNNLWLNPTQRDERILFSSPVTDIVVGGTGSGGSINRIPLDRVMSKVTFILDNTVTGFVPSSISMVNLPYTSQLAAGIVESTDGTSESDYFVIKDREFDGTGHGSRYNIYMLETMLSPQRNVIGNDDGQKYRNRAKRPKLSSNSNLNNYGDFVYAPKKATYALITGTYEGTVNEDGQTKDVVADVQYTIPLGFTNASDKFNDYSIHRNHSYTYKIRVVGINDIRVEALRNDPNERNERHPGTEGDVLISDVHWYLDSHFEQRVLGIKRSDLLKMKIEEMQFTVATPYGTRSFGYNDLMSGSEETNEYCKLTKWIEFRQNRLTYKNTFYGIYYYYPDESAQIASIYPTTEYLTPNGSYDEAKHNILSLRGFVNLLVEQKAWLKKTPDDDIARKPSTVFGAVRSLRALDKVNHYPGEAFFTVFFDEYYYDANPIDGSHTTWRDFTNTAPRKFIISLESNVSKDGKSKYFTTPFISVSQRPIYVTYDKTVPEAYNGDEKSLYGIETINETGLVNMVDVKTGRYLPKDEEKYTYMSGYFNTFRYFKRPTAGYGDWSDLYKDNDWYFLSDPKDDVKIDPFKACLLRNRDENHNGVIDPEEVVWYLPAIGQLLGVQVADLSLPKDVRLFRSANNVNGAAQNNWLVSSTPGNRNNFSYFLWTNQGMSIGSETREASGPNKSYGYQIRCFRNLHAVPGGDYDALGHHRLANASQNSVPAFVAPNFMNKRSVRLPHQFIDHGETALHSYHHEYDHDPAYSTWKTKRILPNEEPYSSLPFREFYYASQNITTYKGHPLTTVDCYKSRFAGSEQEKRDNPSPCADYEEGGIRGWRVPTMRELQLIAEAGVTTNWPDGDYFVSTLPEDVGSLPSVMLMLKSYKDSPLAPFHIYSSADSAKRVFVRCVKDKE